MSRKYSCINRTVRRTLPCLEVSQKVLGSRGGWSRLRLLREHLAHHEPRLQGRHALDLDLVPLRALLVTVPRPAAEFSRSLPVYGTGYCT